MSVKNGFTHLGTIIIGIVISFIYWFLFLHVWYPHYTKAQHSQFLIFGVIVFIDALWIGSMSSPIIKNGLFWLAIGIWLVLFVWMGATGGQNMVDPQSWLK